jgi:predicted HTH transcriptional regulator
MKCSRCNREIPEDEAYTRGRERLCEDCYMKAVQQVQACDPVATRLALRIREKLGVQGTDSLTSLQKAIYDFVQSKGKVTTQEITAHLDVSGNDLDTQLAVLRHCELTKGHKEGDTVYIVPFTYR